jgi:cell division protein FtsQ
MKRTRPNRRKPPKRELPQLPRLPRVAINWRAVFACCATATVLALALALGRELLELPVRKLEMAGNFQRVSKLEIAAAAAPALEESFMSVDLDAVRFRIEAIAWIDSVRLRRVWPDTLLVAFTEHRAAARWGETGLLNARGELFTDDVRQEYRELPRLEGPEGSHRRVADRYLRVRDHLARTTLTLDSIQMDPRGAFTVEFVGGLSVRLGREDVDARIDLFFDVAIPKLGSETEDARYVDMRYANGFAVGWRDSPGQDATLARLDTDG